MLEFMRPIWTVRDCVRAVLGVCFIIYEINCVLVRMRPEMAMDSGSQSGTDVERMVVNNNPRGTVHMNSVHEYLCEIMCLD